MSLLGDEEISETARQRESFRFTIRLETQAIRRRPLCLDLQIVRHAQERHQEKRMHAIEHAARIMLLQVREKAAKTGAVATSYKTANV